MIKNVHVVKGTKAVLLAIGIIMLVSFLSGCERIGECYECDQKEKLKKYVRQGGMEVYLCEDCTRVYKFFNN